MAMFNSNVTVGYRRVCIIHLHNCLWILMYMCIHIYGTHQKGFYTFLPKLGTSIPILNYISIMCIYLYIHVYEYKCKYIYIYIICIHIDI